MTDQFVGHGQKGSVSGFVPLPDGIGIFLYIGGADVFQRIVAAGVFGTGEPHLHQFAELPHGATGVAGLFQHLVDGYPVRLGGEEEATVAAMVMDDGVDGLTDKVARGFGDEVAVVVGGVGDVRFQQAFQSGDFVGQVVHLALQNEVAAEVVVVHGFECLAPASEMDVVEPFVQATGQFAGALVGVGAHVANVELGEELADVVLHLSLFPFEQLDALFVGGD